MATSGRYVLMGRNKGLVFKQDGLGGSTVNTQQVSLLRAVSVDITSAQLLALFTTPIEIVAAPDSGFMLEFVSATVIYKAGATPYTIGSATNLAVKYTDGSGTTVSATQAVTGMIDQATNQIRMIPGVATAFTPATAAKFVLTLAGANPSAGDGTLTVKVFYRVLPTT